MGQGRGAWRVGVNLHVHLDSLLTDIADGGGRRGFHRVCNQRTPGKDP